MEMKKGMIPDGCSVEHSCELIIWRQEFGAWFFSNGEDKPGEERMIPSGDIIGIIIEDDTFEPEQGSGPAVPAADDAGDIPVAPV